MQEKWAHRGGPHDLSLIMELKRVYPLLLAMCKVFGLMLFVDLRKGLRGGGVGALVKSKFKPRKVCLNNEKTHQHVFVQLSVEDREAIFGVGYIPPGNPKAKSYAQLFKYLLDAAEISLGVTPTFVVDLNAPSIIMKQNSLKCKSLDGCGQIVSIAKIMRNSVGALGNVQVARPHPERHRRLDHFYTKLNLSREIRNQETLVTTGDRRHHVEMIFDVTVPEASTLKVIIFETY